MGYVPLVIWFVCVTTILLLLTHSTLARTYKAVVTKKLAYQELSAALLSALVLLDQDSLPASLGRLVGQLPGVAINPEAISKMTWLEADKAMFTLLAQAPATSPLHDVRPKLVAAAQMLHHYQTALQSYNEFVSTLPTSYGAFLFGYKRMVA